MIEESFFGNPEQLPSWRFGSEVVTECQMRQAQAQANEAESILKGYGAPDANCEDWRQEKNKQFKGFLDQLKAAGLSDE